MERPPISSLEASSAEKPEALDRLEQTLEEIRNYHSFVNQRLQEYPKKEKQITTKASETRTVDLTIPHQRGSFYLKDTAALPDGREHFLSYQVDPSDHGPGRNSEGVLEYKTSESKKTELDFNQHLGPIDLKVFDDKRVLGLQEDGLHTLSHAQIAWDHTWSDFQRSLCENKKFLDFLERTESDDSIARVNRKWATDFLHGRVKVADARPFLEEVSDFWKTAVGAALPKKLVPKTERDNRPPDDVYELESVQKTVTYMHERLKDCISRLDQVLLRPSSPYRESARVE